MRGGDVQQAGTSSYISPEERVPRPHPQQKRCRVIYAKTGRSSIAPERLAETDMFAVDPSSELYAHMNANYVRLNQLPDFDHYGQLLEAVARGDYFISMGEVLLPKVEVSTASPGSVAVRATAQWTFPLAFGEIVWSDGNRTFTGTFPLKKTRPFGDATSAWKTGARDWKWARVAVWDIAGNGAFINPIRR